MPLFKSKIRRVSGNSIVNEAPIQVVTKMDDNTSSKTASNTGSFISGLPVELLSLIFEYTNPENRVTEPPMSSEASFDPDEDAEAEDDWNLDPPFNFPYNLASVCNLWREILSSKTELWTKLTFFVDSSQPTPMKEVTQFLEWSHDLPISVTVTRSEGTKADPWDNQENRRTRAIIDALKPHIPRCTEIMFDVLHGSSLPTVSRDLYRLSSSLTRLQLQCQFDDGCPFNLDECGPKEDVIARPDLRELTLHGHALVDVLMNTSEFLFQETISGLDFIKFGKLRVDNYRGHLHQMIIPRMLLALAKPRATICCTLEDIEGSRAPRQEMIIVRTMSLIFRQLNKPIMKFLIKYVDMSVPDHFQIESCPVKDLFIDRPNSVCFKNINEDLRTALCMWTGSVAEFENCNGFDDDLLDHFANQPATEGSLDTLTIRNCRNYTVEGLKNLCLKRLDSSTCPPYNADRLITLEVHGETPDISDSDGVTLYRSLRPDDNNERDFLWEGKDFRQLSILMGTEFEDIE